MVRLRVRTTYSMTLFVCQNLFYSEDGGTGEVVTLSGTAAENKKPEDANSAAGIILVGRAWVFRSFSGSQSEFNSNI